MDYIEIGVCCAMLEISCFKLNSINPHESPLYQTGLNAVELVGTIMVSIKCKTDLFNFIFTKPIVIPSFPNNRAKTMGVKPTKSKKPTVQIAKLRAPKPDY